MKNFWKNISFNGTERVTDPIELQSLVITNRISVIAIIFLLTVGILLGLREWNAEPIFVFSFSIVFVIILLLTRWQYQNTARLLLCFMAPILIVGMSVVSKLLPGESITETEYFDYRFVLITTSIIPPLIFGFGRKTFLFICVLFYFASFILFDPIHNFFNVGYYQIEHSIPSYQISQWVSTLMFCFIIIGVLVMRRTSDGIHKKNIQLIEDLNNANLLSIEQHQRIDKQNDELSVLNTQLANKVVQANKHLEETNKELVKHNNELQQFSYIVSHNLRGPVASLLGLINLVKHDEFIWSHPVFEHIRKSAKNLEITVSDLGRIVDVRNDIFKLRQHIHIDSLLDEVLLPFRTEIVNHDIQIERNITCKEFYSIKPMLTSIVYNLISNAIKYRAKNIASLIQIKTFDKEGKFHLVVEDNGIGIDVDSNKEDLYKLYKRFNTHTEGKGIGLYLVNLQVDALGGVIAVESELDSFTKFSIQLPKPTNLNHQVLFDVPYAQLYFDATLNLVGIQWKREVSSEEFRLALQKCMDLMTEHCAPHGLMDIRDRGGIHQEDEIWLLDTCLPSLFKLGLKRLAVVYADRINPKTLNFYEKNTDVFLKYDIQIHFSTSMDSAFEWLDEKKFVAVNVSNSTKLK